MTERGGLPPVRVEVTAKFLSDAADRQRAERRGHLAQSPEFTDCVVLTYDGIDYLAVLREFSN